MNPLIELVEYLGGRRDTPSARFPLTVASPLWGLWWGFLALVILLFCGQSSKFIYIDF